MKAKKGYPRNPYSFERVLKDLADEVGYESLEKIIDKKRKAIEHISNPNFKDRQLHIQDGLELDIFCKNLVIIKFLTLTSSRMHQMIRLISLITIKTTNIKK